MGFLSRVGVGLALGAPGRAAEGDVLTALEDPVEEGLGELWVVKDLAPLTKLLVRGQHDRSASQASLVDDAVEDVGGGVGVIEVAGLVDDEPWGCT